MSAAKAIRSDASDRQRKIIAGAIFGMAAVGMLYYELADPSPSPLPQPVTVSTSSTTAPISVTGTAAKSIGTSSAALDPTLHMQAMLVTESVAYTGSGRNIFAEGAVFDQTAKAIPKPVAAPRPLGSDRSGITVPVSPPLPPPIDLKFFGTASSAKGGRQAFLLHNDDVFLASTGDIVQRKYKVVSINANSIQIEDLTNNNRQTLPLLVGR